MTDAVVFTNPVKQGQVVRRIVALGLGQGFQGEADKGQNGGADRKHDDKRADQCPGFPQPGQRYIGAFSGNSCIGFSGTQHFLIDIQHHHAQRQHYKGINIAPTRVGAVQVAVHFGCQCVESHRQAQKLGRREYTQSGGKNQQNGRHNGRTHQRNGDFPENPASGGFQDLGRFLQVGIHIPQDPSDQDIGIGRIVQSRDHHHRKQAVGEPIRGGKAGDSLKQAHGTAHHLVFEKVRPGNGQGPGGHDVEQHKQGGAELLAPHICTDDQVGKQAPDHDGDGTRQGRAENGIDQWLYKGFEAVFACKDLCPVIGRKCACRLFYPADLRRMYQERIPENVHQGPNHKIRQGNNQKDQNNILRLAQKGCDSPQRCFQRVSPLYNIREGCCGATPLTPGFSWSKRGLLNAYCMASRKSSISTRASIR